MKPDSALLIELSRNMTGANVHQAKNLEYAYRGFCRRSAHGPTPEARRKARERAGEIEQEIRRLISESPASG